MSFESVKMTSCLNSYVNEAIIKDYVNAKSFLLMFHPIVPRTNFFIDYFLFLKILMVLTVDVDWNSILVIWVKLVLVLRIRLISVKGTFYCNYFFKFIINQYNNYFLSSTFHGWYLMILIIKLLYINLSNTFSKIFTI